MARREPQPESNDPDRRPSKDLIVVEMRGKDLLWLLDVPRLGALLIRTSSYAPNPSGKEMNEGLSTFTNAQIGRYD